MSQNEGTNKPKAEQVSYTQTLGLRMSLQSRNHSGQSQEPSELLITQGNSASITVSSKLHLETKCLIAPFQKEQFDSQYNCMKWSLSVISKQSKHTELSSILQQPFTDQVKNVFSEDCDQRTKYDGAC